MKNLIDKTCLIVDAKENLGQAVGLFLAKQGTRLVLCFDKNDSIDNGYLKQLDDINAKYLVEECVFSSFENAQAMISDVRGNKEFSDLDSMFVNITPKVKKERISEFKKESLDDLINNHILKAYCATKIVADYMSENNKGVIVYRSSLNADKPTGIAPFDSMYYAAVKNLNREAALYYGNYHIRTASLEIGALGGEDKAYRNDITNFYEGYEYKIPSGYVGNSDDIGSLVAYLISDECNYINGAEIRVDGGLLFQYIEAVMNIRTHERLRREGKE